MGFTEAFSVQISVLNMMLPEIEAQKLKPDRVGDILVNASTGSGKTLAYLIPIIESLYRRVVPRVRADYIGSDKTFNQSSQINIITTLEWNQFTNCSIEK